MQSLDNPQRDTVSGDPEIDESFIARAGGTRAGAYPDGSHVSRFIIFRSTVRYQDDAMINRVGTHYTFQPLALGELVRTRFGNIPAIPDRRPYTSIVVHWRQPEDEPRLESKNGRVLLQVNIRDLSGGSEWHNFEAKSAIAFIAYRDSQDVWLEQFEWTGNQLRIVSCRSSDTTAS